MRTSEFQKNIIKNIRGFYLTQIISYLGKSGYLDKILAEDLINLKKNKLNFSPEVLKTIFDYFSNIGFSIKIKNNYRLTELGKDVLRRYSSYFVPHSYKNYLYNLDKLLKNKKDNINVDRFENILGSGKTHLRYFIHAIHNLKKEKSITSLIDIGVGNGDFAINLNKQIKLKKTFGVDFSNVSVKESTKALNKQRIKNKVIYGDGGNVDKWAKLALNFLKNESVAISLWFLIHEITDNSEKKIISFLNKIKSYFPNSPLIICELVKIPNTILSKNKDITYIPEYLFFHQLSSQNVLELDKLSSILQKSKYKIKSKIFFDEIREKSKVYPSCVLYTLK